MVLIELHSFGRSVAIAVGCICTVYQSQRGGCKVTIGNGEIHFHVDESYEEVMEKIREAAEDLEPEDFQISGFATGGGEGKC